MIATADLSDERGDELASLSSLQVLNLGGRAQVSGPVRTVRCFQDNALLKSILSTPGDGAVLVVDGGGSLETALIGDIIGDLAVANGWAGVVVNGAVRDRVALASLDLGVRALGTNPRRGTRTGAGEADAVVRIAGVDVRPGVMLWSDEDGIVVER